MKRAGRSLAAVSIAIAFCGPVSAQLLPGAPTMRCTTSKITQFISCSDGAGWTMTGMPDAITNAINWNDNKGNRYRQTFDRYSGASRITGANGVVITSFTSPITGETTVRDANGATRRFRTDPMTGEVVAQKERSAPACQEGSLMPCGPGGAPGDAKPLFPDAK